jgi:hypothetical protein
MGASRLAHATQEERHGKHDREKVLDRDQGADQVGRDTCLVEQGKQVGREHGGAEDHENSHVRATTTHPAPRHHTCRASHHRSHDEEGRHTGPRELAEGDPRPPRGGGRHAVSGCRD